MKFDQTWMADLLAMQKKAAELAKNPNTGAEVQNLVKDFLHQWGINQFPWEENPEAGNVIRTGPDAERPAKPNWNIDITETKHQVIVETIIPGLADPNDLVIKLQGEILTIRGKSSALQTDNPEGVFHRQVRLPAAVGAPGATAGYRAGKLRIILPKNTTATEEIIPVNWFEPKIP